MKGLFREGTDMHGRIAECGWALFGAGFLLMVAGPAGCGGPGQPRGPVVPQEEQRPAPPDRSAILLPKGKGIDDAAVKGQFGPIKPVDFCEGPRWFEIERGMQVDDLGHRNQFHNRGEFPPR